MSICFYPKTNFTSVVIFFAHFLCQAHLDPLPHGLSHMLLTKFCMLFLEVVVTSLKSLLMLAIIIQLYTTLPYLITAVIICKINNCRLPAENIVM